MQNYSFSRDIGSGSGSSFSTEGEGRVTGVRVWEINNAYITGWVPPHFCAPLSFSLLSIHERNPATLWRQITFSHLIGRLSSPPPLVYIIHGVVYLFYLQDPAALWIYLVCDGWPRCWWARWNDPLWWRIHPSGARFAETKMFSMSYAVPVTSHCCSCLQISGKYHPSNYIYQLMMVTSKGRILLVGQPTQVQNFYPFGLLHQSILIFTVVY